MLFRQLFDARSSTYTYLCADEKSREAVLIDPVYEKLARDAALLRELGLALRFTLETHVHADHVTAAWLLKERFGSSIVVGKKSGAEGADRYVSDGDLIEFGSEALDVRETPGHTSGCLSYVTRERTMAFTGDALMIRSAGRTDFQEGDARRLYQSVHQQLFTLPPECLIYPAHDYQGRTSSTVGEERAHNPRLGGLRSEDDFVGTMSNLGLPHPKQIDVALPANLRCGRPLSTETPPDATWGPARSYAGIIEVDAEYLHEHARELNIVDVRTPAEYTGELGHIAGARLIPLDELRGRLAELPRDKPLVAVCRSGGRSAQAQVILENAGYQSANLSGGMIRWRALSLPVEAAPRGTPPPSAQGRS